MRVIDYFDRGVELDPNRELVRSVDGGLTYAEGSELSWRLAASQLATGASRGHRVGVLSPNHPRALAAMLGLWRAELAWTPLHPMYPVPYSIKFMNQVGMKILFFHSSIVEDPAAVRAAVPSLTTLVCLDAEVAGATSFEEFLASGEGHPVGERADVFGAPDDVCAVVSTGGTTGEPKAVIATNQVWATMIESGVQHFPPADDPVFLMVAPIGHAAGAVAIMTMPLGVTIVMKQKFDAADVLQTIEDESVSHLFVPPTAFYAMLDQPNVAKYDYSSLKMLMLIGSPVVPAKFARGVEVFGPSLCQAYGQAEAPMMISWLAPAVVAAAVAGEHPERLASCGRPTLQCRVGIMDDDGRVLGPGEPGEVVVRGRLVSPGYLNNPQATSDVHAFGWHHTGDVGYLDDDGYLYIVDRKKDMIVTGGFNVYPAEIEAVIAALETVESAAVIGVPHEHWGEEVLAVVVPSRGSVPDPDAIKAACRDALGPIKTPKRVILEDRLPTTAVGKIDKRAVRATFWEGQDRLVH